MRLMTEHTHSLNHDVAERYLFGRYERFGEEKLPFEYVRLLPEYIGTKIPDNEVLFQKMIKSVIAYSYIEPENPYLYHTSYASARGFNSNELVLEISGDNTRKYYIYDLKSDEWIFLHEEKVEERRFVAYFHILSNRGRLGAKYGDFGYILSLLDAGHFLENIKCFFEEERLSLNVDYNGYSNNNLGLLSKPYQIVPLLKLDISSVFINIDAVQWSTEKTGILFFSNEYTGNSAGGLIDEFIDKVLNSQESLCENFEDGIGYNTKVYVKDLWKRTSSQSAQGYSFFPYKCKQQLIDDLVYSISDLLQTMDDKICAHIIVNDSNISVYVVKNNGVYIKDYWDIDINNIPHDSLDYVDLKNVSLVVILSTNCNLYRKSEVQYQYTYIKMGEIAQRLSNICSLTDLSARPMKNMNDLYIKEKLLGEEFDPGYLLVIGKSMNDSLKMSI